MLFRYQLNPANILGIAVAWGGMVCYTEVKRREDAASKAAAAAAVAVAVPGVELADARKKDDEHTV